VRFGGRWFSGAAVVSLGGGFRRAVVSGAAVVFGGRWVWRSRRHSVGDGFIVVFRAMVAFHSAPVAPRSRAGQAAGRSAVGGGVAGHRRWDRGGEPAA